LKQLKDQSLAVMIAIDTAITQLEKPNEHPIPCTETETKDVGCGTETAGVETADNMGDSFAEQPLDCRKLYSPPVSSTSGSVVSPRQRPRSIVGCGPKDPKVTASLSRREFFISNVSIDVTVEDIQHLLGEKVTVLWCDQISHPDSSSRSFLLIVSNADAKIVRDPNFWPPGIECRDFVRPKQGHLANVGKPL
jgi:hypothetical protein